MVAQCCSRMREAAYNDSVWQALFRREWPSIPFPPAQPTPPAWRHLFFDRWKACRQFRFQDPSVSKWACEGFSPVWQIAINFDQSITCLTCAELSTWTFSDKEAPVRNVSKHKRACKTGEKALMVPIELPMLDLRGCPAVSVDSGFHPVMLTSVSLSAGAEEAGRLNSPITPTPFEVGRTKKGERTPSSEALAPKEHFFLVAEDKVRLYSSLRGCCRTLSTTPPERVLALTDRVLDLPAGAPEAVIATGGEDKVVRLWTLGSRRKGEQRLVCTLRGHEDAIVFLSVARHDPSLLVSVGSAGTVKLWDAASALELRGATAGASKSCLATWKVLGPTAGLAMCGHVCYVAGKTAVTAIDLRSLRVLGPVASHADRISAMALNAAGDRLSTGTTSGSVFLWDPTLSDFLAPKPLAELTSHSGPVAQILIDRFKVVTRTDFESRVHVSAADTGVPICSFPPEGDNSLQLEWRADKLLMTMRGPLLVLGKLHIVSADFSRSRIAYECDEKKEEEQGSGDDLGRFWERHSDDVEDDSDAD
ncbi:hypothetical protein KFL_000170220 [Klebsormidium nitens]|uniref:Uncharacterized protein n=1 Tax=Klebsormidium nitens TaxID=105231 RepID=A0A1Y1HPZ4_KLENI|nr:hypothetical protein KFL_000170220 [Klebsormidium nitens]|eukprot:GAQ78676.1 hypothetical protein KFL_000170220 [Klebsormidium nitens]